MNYEDMPLAYDLLSSMPGIGVSTAWNMRRVSNTITGGGTMNRPRLTSRLLNVAERIRPDVVSGPRAAIGSVIDRVRGTPGNGGFIRQGVPQTFGPRHFGRLTRAANIDPIDSSTYSPFGFAAKAGNRGVRAAANFEVGRKMISKVAGGDIDFTADAFSRGSMGRVAAMAKIQNMGERRFARTGERMFASLADMGVDNPTISKLVRTSILNEGKMSQFAAASAVGGTMRGQISGRLAGYFQGAQAARMGDEAIAGARAVGGGFFREGIERGITSHAAGSSVARIVGSRGASAALRAAGPVGNIMLVRDLAMMAGKVVGTMGRTVMEAGKNMMAPLNGGPLSGVFKDNAVAATSRQRGVMAIANSRLNMRSVLGNEAAALHAHFA